jgi:hypothetical protein
MLASTLAATTMLLGACGPQQVVADSGCAWVKPLVVTDEEIIVFAANIRVMRPLADQINSLNRTRAEKCA